MVSIFVSLERTGKPNLNLIGGAQENPGLSPRARLLQSNQRPNQLKRQTSSVEMKCVVFCELSVVLTHKNLGAAAPGLR